MESVEKILTNVFDKSLRKLTERQREVVFFYVKDWANLTSKQRKTKALEADKIRSTKERIQVERRARHTRPLTEIEQAEYDAAWNSEPGADLSAAVEPASDRLATPAPVVADGDGPAPLTTAPAWSPKRPQRFQGYGKPLYDLLKAAHAAGQPKPNARDVLDSWKENPPPDVSEVTDNGLKYYNARGNTRPADLEAIRKRIGRMTN